MRQVVIIHFPHVDKYVNRGKGNAKSTMQCLLRFSYIDFTLKKKSYKKNC